MNKEDDGIGTRLCIQGEVGKAVAADLWIFGIGDECSLAFREPVAQIRDHGHGACLAAGCRWIEHVNP